LEPVENLKGTEWEHIGNQRKLKKKKKHPCPLNFKGKNASHLECLPIGCMKFLFPKELVTIFGLD
jgi:hypothetical protein